MSAAARAAEADRATVAFQIALTEIGAKTIEDAIELWSDVPPTRVAETSTRWLERAIRLVLFRRSQSRDLALAYYRLARALRTGTTIADPDKPEPEFVTIEMLRDEFGALVGEAMVEAEATVPLPDEDGDPETPPEEVSSDELFTPEPDADDDELDRILVEEIEGLNEQLAADEARAEQEARQFLDQLGPRNLESKLQLIDTSAEAEEVDALREDAHKQAGLRQASSAEHSVLDGARSTLWNVAQRDDRVVGYVRYSRTGTPCGWCAMLISRGPVYKSEASAERAIYLDGDKYHDNCHCAALPVFSLDEYESSSLFALNRRYSELWPQVTRGHSGKSAISVWRRFIRQEQKLAQAASQ